MAVFLFAASAVALAYNVCFGGPLDAFLVLGALLAQAKDTVPKGSVVGALLPRGFLAFVWTAAAALAVGRAAAAVFGTVYRWRVPQQSLPSWTGPGRPLFFPCRTTHTRIFPKKNHFAYDYLIVGIPVGWTGVANGMISTTNAVADPSPGGWYPVDTGGGYAGLRAELDAVLKANGVDPSSIPYAYVITSARLLGYRFTPVTFWYLYNADKELVAVLIGADNTFDEQRPYYLARETACAPTEEATVFCRTFEKKLFVSPFNSDKGSYSLRTVDPVAPRMQGAGPIDVKLTLRSSDGQAKLVTHLFSAPAGRGTAVDPMAMGAVAKVRFMAAWWWATLVTDQRVLWQASKLFFRRGLHIWLKPMPQKGSRARAASASERALEAIFRAYLRHLVAAAAAATVAESDEAKEGIAGTRPRLVALRYYPGGLGGAAEPEFMLPPCAVEAQMVDVVEVHVLSPDFYTRFVRYADEAEAFACELRDSHTVALTRPELLERLLAQQSRDRAPHAGMPSMEMATSERMVTVAFKAIALLRRRPEPIERPRTCPSSGPVASASPASPASPASSASSATGAAGRVKGANPQGISRMEAFVLAGCGCCGQVDRRRTAVLRRSYSATVLRLVVADWLAWGSVALLQAYGFVFRAGLAWAVAVALRAVV